MTRSKGRFSLMKKNWKTKITGRGFDGSFQVGKRERKENKSYVIVIFNRHCKVTSIQRIQPHSQSYLKRHLSNTSLWSLKHSVSIRNMERILVLQNVTPQTGIFPGHQRLTLLILKIPWHFL